MNKMYYIIGVFIIELLGFSSGYSTKDNLPWYKLLVKSSLTPPDIVFPIVWTVLYFILGLVGSFLFIHRKHPNIKTMFDYFVIQLLFNLAWTPIFFGLHKIGLALIVIIVIIIFNILIIIKAHQKFPILTISMLPYLFWSIFAGYLNLIIWLYN